MGTSSNNKNNENGFIICINKNVNNEENKSYFTYLTKRKFTIQAYNNIELGLNEILYNKENYFKEIYVILSGSFYQDFILKFKERLQNIFVVPKIVIFTKNKESFLEKNDNIKDIIENKFYNLGGIQVLFKGIYEDFLINKKWKKKYEIKNKSLNNDLEGEQYTFEKIDNKLGLYLPTFYKSLIKLNEKDIFNELTHYLYDTYKDNKWIKELLEQIDEIPDIPIEILCKYYARLYTIESKFYNDLNKSLRLLKEGELLFCANKNNYYSIAFIKSLYEGVKLGCFEFELKNKLLYRFSCLEKKEFDNINKFLRNKISGISTIYFFSKTFLSFSEDKKEANKFYGYYKNDKSKSENKNLVPVFFHLVKKEDIKESLYTHIKIDNISIQEGEKEILFLPFTCFEILKVIAIGEKANVKSISNKKRVEYYEIELTYLGQYENELKNIEKEEKLPDTKFKSCIAETNFIEINKDITNRKVIDEFNDYEKSFRKNNKDIYIIYEVKDKDIDENHFVSIFGRNLEENGTDFVKENKEKIKIIINNEEKALEYKYELKKGYHKIIIKLISDEIINLSYMFYGCTSLKSIEGLKYLDTKNITDFSKMLNGCESLSDIKGLQDWDVSNGKDFSDMLAQCKSLSDIKPLENWNVLNGNNFGGMFCQCESLSDIKPLENWNVSNGNNFSCIFRECKLLSDIKPLENWNVSNGNNFSGIFRECKLLSDIKPLENWNVSNGNNFSGIFRECKSLSDIKPLEKWDVSNGNNFSQLFHLCTSLKDIKGLQNWNVSNSKDFSYIFYECILLSDIKPLESWNVSNANNFECMFYNCKSLSDIKGLQNWNVSNGINFSGIFGNCKSLSEINALENWNVSKGINFSNVFLGCESLVDINGLQNWNVSNGNNFVSMFCLCKSLSYIKPIENWNVSNGKNFSTMFSGCYTLADYQPIMNWNTHGFNFLLMASNELINRRNND